MSVLLHRVEHGWAENGNNEAWVQYFTSWYLRKVQLSQSQQETLGTGMLWSCHWLPCQGLAGLPASQQPAEQFNRKFKSNMWSGGTLKTHRQIIERLIRCVENWTRPEVDSERPLTLTAREASCLISLNFELRECIYMFIYIYIYIHFEIYEGCRAH